MTTLSTYTYRQPGIRLADLVRLALLGSPIAVLFLLLWNPHLDPQLQAPGLHFVIVTLAAGMAALVGLLVLLVAERRRRLGGGDVIRFLDLLGGLPIVVDGPVSIPDLVVLLALGREHRLSAYDAAYLHLAMREHLPLAPRDRALRAAARAARVLAFAVR